VGLPTVLATCLYTVATRVGANRIVRGGRFHHPFGAPELSATEEYDWRRKFVERTIQALCTPVQQPTVFEVDAVRPG
jgi:glycine/betaine/sarcosine/D-proline reductase family selenoprotein B